MEEWKPVPIEGYTHYIVSNTGRVKRLAREVPVTVRNNGRLIDTVAKRKEVEIHPQIDGGAMYVILSKSKKEKIKKSLPMLVLKLFGPPCPGEENLFVAYHIDNNIKNNNIDNLEWMPRRTLATIAAMSSENRETLIKYHNIVVYYEDTPVGYYKDSNDMRWHLYQMGFGKCYSVSRLMKMGCKLLNLFDVKEVTDEEYEEISLHNFNNDLKIIASIVERDREKVGRVKKVIEYKEKIVYKPKIEKQIVEKIVYKEKPVKEKKNEKVKEKKKMLVNDRSTDVKKTTKQKTSELDDIDDTEFFKEQELKKKRFMEEMKKRLHI